MQPLNLKKIKNKIIFSLVIILGIFLLSVVFNSSFESLNLKRNEKLSVYILSSAIVVSEKGISEELKAESGVVVWRDGYILTAGHILSDEGFFNKINVQAHDGTRACSFPAKIIARDKNLDIMAIRVPYDFGGETPISCGYRFRRWEKLYTIGCPFSACGTYAEGNFLTYGSFTADDELVDSLLFDMVAAHGSSGEGVFNKTGSLVSIVTAYQKEQHRISLGPTTNDICKFLERNRLPYRKTIW